MQARSVCGFFLTWVRTYENILESMHTHLYFRLDTLTDVSTAIYPNI